MTSLVLSQPMLFPWRGMFEQVKLADIFVFHDDIQLPRSHGKGKSFQTRVQIKTQGGWEWLTLPIDRRASLDLLIKDARFPDQGWRKQHLVAIRNAYRSAPYFQTIFEGLVKPTYEFQTDSVCEFCIEGMTRLFNHLDLSPKIYRTSELEFPRELVASGRIVEHCKRFGASDYITGLGALDYIDYDLFDQNGIRIHYMEYANKPYPQLHGPFNPYVSALDLLFNVGDDFPTYFASCARYWKELDVARSSYKRK